MHIIMLEVVTCGFKIYERVIKGGYLKAKECICYKSGEAASDWFVESAVQLCHNFHGA